MSIKAMSYILLYLVAVLLSLTSCGFIERTRPDTRLTGVIVTHHAIRIEDERLYAVGVPNLSQYPVDESFCFMEAFGIDAIAYLIVVTEYSEDGNGIISQIFTSEAMNLDWDNLRISTAFLNSVPK